MSKLKVEKAQLQRLKREKDTDLDDLCNIVSKADAEFGILIYKAKDEDELTMMVHHPNHKYKGFAAQVFNVTNQLWEYVKLKKAAQRIVHIETAELTNNQEEEDATERTS